MAEITPLEDSIGGEPVKAEVGAVLLSDLTPDQIHFAYDKGLHTGNIITFCQHYSGQPVPLEKGKTYYSSMVRVVCGEHQIQEYVAYQAPFSSQFDTDGNEIMGDLPSFPSVRKTESGFVYRDNYNPYIPDYANAVPAVVEKTDDETVGQWVLWSQAQKSYFQHYPILATNSLELLPTFHERQCFISSGRAISKEEFETGAKVCLIPNIWAGNSPSNRDDVGSIIVVPFYCTLHGYSSNVEKEEAASAVFQKRYSLLDAAGSAYLPFWVGEYKVVGIYDMAGRYICNYGETEIMPDMMIIPAKSVEAEDQNIIHWGPMLDTTTSFQIPNGTIETFDKALHEAVPEADQLTISYDDNGYEKVVADFQAARRFALILLFISLAAILSVVVLLLYFFIVRQKKRIAIERSLGMTKRQCVVSLTAGLIVLTMVASVIGTVSAATVWDHTELFSQQEESTDDEFDPTFSIWAKKQEYQPEIESEIFVPIMMYLFVPVGVVLVVSLLAVFAALKHVAEPPLFLLSAA